MSVSEAGRALPLARGGGRHQREGPARGAAPRRARRDGLGRRRPMPRPGSAHAAIVTPKRPLGPPRRRRTAHAHLHAAVRGRAGRTRGRAWAASGSRPRRAPTPVRGPARARRRAPGARDRPRPSAAPSRSRRSSPGSGRWRPRSTPPRDRIRAIDAELDDDERRHRARDAGAAGLRAALDALPAKGSFTSPGERVYAALPAVLGALPDDQPPNRLGLARWLVSDDNPLTARVAVNRFWETLFGRGPRATVEDFGSQGERPSHPELLDWLAVEFMEKGWSQKTILREIVIVGHLPPGLGRERGAARARPRQPAARARRALPRRGRDGARRRTLGRGPL